MTQQRPISSNPIPAIVVGQTVYAEDGAVGRIERVIRTESAEPRYAVLSVRRRFRRRHPVVPCELVTATDSQADAVYVHGPRAFILSLSESMPIVV